MIDGGLGGSRSLHMEGAAHRLLRGRRTDPLLGLALTFLRDGGSDDGGRARRQSLCFCSSTSTCAYGSREERGLIRIRTVGIVGCGWRDCLRGRSILDDDDITKTTVLVEFLDL